MVLTEAVILAPAGTALQWGMDAEGEKEMQPFNLMVKMRQPTEIVIEIIALLGKHPLGALMDVIITDRTTHNSEHDGGEQQVELLRWPDNGFGNSKREVKSSSKRLAHLKSNFWPQLRKRRRYKAPNMR